MRRSSWSRGGLMVASVLLHLSLSSPTAGVSPQALRSEQLLARVQAHYDRTTRLHARFRQETRLQGFAQVQSGEGEVWILKPGQMRWHYTKPERQTIIANGETLWIYLPEDRQVIRDRVQTSPGARTPALFLAGQARLTELFTVAGAESQVASEDGLLQLELIPKEGMLPYTHVALGIQPTSYQVVRVQLTDPLGSVTTMWFADVNTEAAVDPSLFQFEVPPGVDVVSPPAFPAPR